MDLLEAIAAALHEGWLKDLDAKGFRYSPERNREKRLHPHFVPWSALDTEAQNQDRFQAAVLLREWKEGHLAQDNLPERIHEAWRVWEQASRFASGEDPHPHD